MKTADSPTGDICITQHDLNDSHGNVRFGTHMLMPEEDLARRRSEGKRKFSRVTSTGDATCKGDTSVGNGSVWCQEIIIPGRNQGSPAKKACLDLLSHHFIEQFGRRNDGANPELGVEGGR